jgi:putative tricarboxylic transport membrane protein
MFVAGCLGFFFRRMEFPLGPLILGLLLGDICESNMRRALSLSMGNYKIFVGSAVSIILIVAMIAVLFGPFVIGKIKKAKAK